MNDSISIFYDGRKGFQKKLSVIYDVTVKSYKCQYMLEADLVSLQELHKKWILLLKPYLVNAVICGFVHSTEEIFKVKFFVQYEIAIWAVNPFVSNK